jgi:hypothetical protein
MFFAFPDERQKPSSLLEGMKMRRSSAGLKFLPSIKQKRKTKKIPEIL